MTATKEEIEEKIKDVKEDRMTQTAFLMWAYDNQESVLAHANRKERFVLKNAFKVLSATGHKRSA